MNIEKICNLINSAIEKARKPLPSINSILLYCTALKRPGMSAMLIASRIIRRQAEAGAPFGPAADGSANIMEAMERIRAEEYMNAFNFESVIDTVIPIGGIRVIVTGANSGGPFVANGYNINWTQGKGIPKV